MQTTIAPPTPSLLVGILCGSFAALGWAAGFVAAKHGVTIGFTPADLALHRFVWTGVFMLPFVAALGLPTLGGIGWGRGFVLWALSGPPQALLAYSGFILVPLGHGTVIQPACATLFGLLLATLVLSEKVTARRVIGAVVIVCGLLVFGFESVSTIGSHGVGGDLLFAAAGISWAIFGTLLRRWQVPGMRAALIVGAISVLLFLPFHALAFGYGNIVRLGLFENVLQILIQGLLAGAAPIYLFGISVARLGAGRAATFTALVPGFSLILGYLTLGIVPTLAQIAGLVVVVIGFQFTVRR